MVNVSRVALVPRCLLLYYLLAHDALVQQAHANATANFVPVRARVRRAVHASCVQVQTYSTNVWLSLPVRFLLNHVHANCTDFEPLIAPLNRYAVIRAGCTYILAVQIGRVAMRGSAAERARSVS